MKEIMIQISQSLLFFLCVFLFIRYKTGKKKPEIKEESLPLQKTGEETTALKHENRVSTDTLSCNDTTVNSEKNKDKSKRYKNYNIPVRKKILIINDDSRDSDYLDNDSVRYFDIIHVCGRDSSLMQIVSQCPDMIISEVILNNFDGINLCKQVKQNKATRHIPFIFLTNIVSEELEWRGIEVGAEDYITRPFNKNYLKTRIDGILKKQSILSNHLFTAIPFTNSGIELTNQEKQFMEQLTAYVENNLEDLKVKELAKKMGMSNSFLYKKIKQLTGKSVVEFVRSARLKKGASLLMNTRMQVSEVALSVGFNDIKYFRKLFQQQYGVNPSSLQKKHSSLLQNEPHFKRK
jgi:PleD family two-component response regulator